MNNNDNKGISIVPVAMTILVMLAFGYFLFKSSPQNSDNNNRVEPGTQTNNSPLDSLIGKPLPDIQLTDKDGKIYAAENFKGKNTVLFFNEGLMCYPACWNQIAGFGSDSRFDTDQIQAFSVLVDSSRDWQRAIDKMPELAKAKTLFDAGAVVSGKLGLLTLPSSMHRGSLPGHTYIVLDKEGIVRYVNDDPNMAMANEMLISKIAGFKQ